MTNRIYLIDLARSFFLLAMVIFHFAYDMMLFGYAPEGMIYAGFWPYWARMTAGGFLFLAGVSLWLAHGQAKTVQWPRFWRRFFVITGAALLVTIGTYFALGEQFIRWGILHMIAAGSLLGVFALRLPLSILAGGTLAALILPHFMPKFDLPWLLWLGMARPVPFMADYTPVLPWLGPILAGIFSARVADKMHFWSNIARWQPSGIWRRMVWPGQHSLFIYLIHQPILFGIFFLFKLA